MNERRTECEATHKNPNTPNFYQSDPKKFTDAELATLIQELEGAVGGCCLFDFAEGSWERQACERMEELWAEEKRRWREAHPPAASRVNFEEAAKRAADFINETTAASLYESSPVFDRLKRGGA